MKIRVLLSFAIVAALLTCAQTASGQAGSDSDLLKTREMVWRAWFADQTGTLQALVPSDTLVISAGEHDWKRQADVLRAADEFHASGGKLLSLEFPRTEVQHFGDVAVIWSEYKLELETNGKRSSSSGRVTEIFVKRDGHWVNPGWHTDAEK